MAIGVDSAYLGIVVEQALRDRGALRDWDVVARRRVGGWDFVLVRVHGQDLDRRVAELQRAMVDDDTWYAHFFAGNRLVLVFRDAVFRVGTDPGTWGPAIAHGLAGGVPREQLDFHPRTASSAEAFFGLG